jgi:hypothetical protein
MSFLEITKIHLARQEKAKSASAALTLDHRLMHRIVWRSEKVIVFQDREGHFWRYLRDSGKSEHPVIKPKSN